jgi:hypothetical protein
VSGTINQAGLEPLLCNLFAKKTGNMSSMIVKVVDMQAADYVIY